MSDQQSLKYKSLRTEFFKVTKRILQKRELSRNPETLQQYAKDLVETYNAIVNFMRPLYHTFKTHSKRSIADSLKKNYETLRLCFSKLPSEFLTPQTLLDTVVLIDQHDAGTSGAPKVAKATVRNENSSSSESEDSITTESQTELIDSFDRLQITPLERQENIVVEEQNEEINENDDLNANNNLDISNLFEQENITMATIEQKTSFLKTCSHYISAKYSGDPNGLESFIDSIELLAELLPNDSCVLKLTI